MHNRRQIGAQYEQTAGRYLEHLGYEILEYNYHTRNGEIDIVARHDGYLVFVEVKYRKNEDKGYPMESVSVTKQRTICKCAVAYMKMQGWEYLPVRFDVVSILGQDIQVIPNAFDFLN